MENNILLILSAVLAWIGDWFPPARKWLDSLQPIQKRIVMIIAVIIVGVFTLISTCTRLGCTDATFTEFGVTLLQALVINYGVHQVTKPEASK